MKIKYLVTACCFLGCIGTARAQVGGVKVQVPFEFNIAKQTLPPGEYVIWSQHDQVYLRMAGGKTVAMVQSNRTVHDGGKTGKVVFNCYEKLCFLSQLWLPDADRSREILVSSAEKQATKRGEPTQLTLLAKPIGSAGTN